MKYLSILLVSFFLFGFTVNNQATGSATTASTKVLNPLATRDYLLVINSGSSAIFAKLASAHVADEGVEIPAGGNWEPFNVPVDAVYLKSATGSVDYSIVEGTK